MGYNVTAAIYMKSKNKSRLKLLVLCCRELLLEEFEQQQGGAYQVWADRHEEIVSDVLELRQQLNEHVPIPIQTGRIRFVLKIAQRFGETFADLSENLPKKSIHIFVSVLSGEDFYSITPPRSVSTSIIEWTIFNI